MLAPTAVPVTTGPVAVVALDLADALHNVLPYARGEDTSPPGSLGVQVVVGRDGVRVTATDHYALATQLVPCCAVDEAGPGPVEASVVLSGDSVLAVLQLAQRQHHQPRPCDDPLIVDLAQGVFHRGRDVVSVEDLSPYPQWQQALTAPEDAATVVGLDLELLGRCADLRAGGRSVGPRRVLTLHGGRGYVAVTCPQVPQWRAAVMPSRLQEAR